MPRIIFSIFCAFMVLTSCDLEQKSYTEEIAKMEDTLFKAFPTVNRVSIEVKNDFGTEINITFGDAELYTASDAVRQEAAQKAAAIVRSVFKPDDLPGKGTLIVVREEHTIQVEEGTEKKLPIPLSEE